MFHSISGTLPNVVNFRMSLPQERRRCCARAAQVRRIAFQPAPEAPRLSVSQPMISETITQPEKR